MKIVDEIETQKQSKRAKKKKTTTITKKIKQRQKRTRRGKSYSERVRAKLFCCGFKLGFLQLIYKTSLLFKSN